MGSFFIIPVRDRHWYSIGTDVPTAREHRITSGDNYLHNRAVSIDWRHEIHWWDPLVLHWWPNTEITELQIQIWSTQTKSLVFVLHEEGAKYLDIYIIDKSKWFLWLTDSFLAQTVNWELSLNSLAFMLHRIEANDSLILSILHDYVADILEKRWAQNDLQESSLSGNYQPTSLHREGILST